MSLEGLLKEESTNEATDAAVTVKKSTTLIKALPKSEKPSPMKAEEHVQNLTGRQKSNTQLKLVNVSKPKSNSRPASVNRKLYSKKDSLKISSMESYDFDEDDLIKEATAAQIK